MGAYDFAAGVVSVFVVFIRDYNIVTQMANIRTTLGVTVTHFVNTRIGYAISTSTGVNVTFIPWRLRVRLYFHIGRVIGGGPTP